VTPLVVCATLIEAKPLFLGFETDFVREELGSALAYRRTTPPLFSVLITGIGKTNSALFLEKYIHTYGSPEQVINTGIAGAYPDDTIKIGDIAVASEEVYADEGAQTETRFLTIEDMGFPLFVKRDQTYFNIFPIPDGKAVQEKLITQTDLAVHCGRFVTVSSCTSSSELYRKRQEQFQPICESMEGAALCHVCTVNDIRFIEVRGISNFVGPYDKKSWQIEPAVRAATGAVMEYMES
jgi:futalosine hydrolase